MPALIAWLAVAATWVVTPSGIYALAAILAVIVYASFGVMRRADALARRLGEPYGTIVLTLSISVIEVAMVASVLLGGAGHPTIARDTAFSGAMILLNLILGVAVLAGGVRHGPLRFQIGGAWRYLAMISLLGAVTFVFPLVADSSATTAGVPAGAMAEAGAVALAAPAASLSAVGLSGVDLSGVDLSRVNEPVAGVPVSGLPALMIALVVGAAYVLFMWRQLGPDAEKFAATEPAPRSEEPAWPNFLWLVATLVPIVLLSDAMSPLLSAAVPHTAIAGLVIAAVVLLPETFTTLKAGWNGQLQRVSNLSHGALVSVLGMSVPAVLAIGATTGQTVILGAGSVELVLLAATLGLSFVVVWCGRAKAWHGVVHLALFAAYVGSLV